MKRDFPLLSSPELDQVQRLMRIAKSPVVQIRSERCRSTCGGPGPRRRKDRCGRAVIVDVVRSPFGRGASRRRA